MQTEILNELGNSIFHHKVNPTENTNCKLSLLGKNSPSQKAPHEEMINSSCREDQNNIGNLDKNNGSMGGVIDNVDFKSLPITNLPVIIGAKEKLKFDDTVLGTATIWNNFFKLQKLNMTARQRLIETCQNNFSFTENDHFSVC